MRFRGHTALVTGASSGIGRATAIALAGEGACVILADRRLRSRDSLERPSTVRLIRREGGAAVVVTCDVSLSAQVTRAVQAGVSAFGPIDLLVNCAGVFVRNPLTEVSDSEWDRVLSVNLGGTFLMCRAVLPMMAAMHYGAVVNVGSIHGMIGTRGAATYCASKGAIHNLTRQLAVDYASVGVRVNAVAPGTIETAMSAPFRTDSALLSEYRARTLLGRLGTPRDVAAAILFLLSDDASFITGHSLVVDGGWTAA